MIHHFFFYNCLNRQKSFYIFPDNQILIMTKKHEYRCVFSLCYKNRNESFLMHDVDSEFPSYPFQRHTKTPNCVNVTSNSARWSAYTYTLNTRALLIYVNICIQTIVVCIPFIPNCTLNACSSLIIAHPSLSTLFKSLTRWLLYG